MTLKVLFAAAPDRWAQYQAPLTRALADAGLDADLSRDHAPAEVDYIVYAPGGPLTDFTPYTRTRAVLGLWAGVEQIVSNPTLTQPLARMVDPGLTQGMVEWVTGHVLRHHLGMDRHIRKHGPSWDRHVPPLAPERPVAILGLGALGTACGQALLGLGFPVRGWSRAPKQVEGIACHHGADGLAAALDRAEIVVTLLPQTPATENILNARTLAMTAHGAVVINPGRGPLIDDEALLAALGTGQIGHATLDVFRVEPLPSTHPYWTHPDVTVTPHIAAETRPASASRVIAENIRRDQSGAPLLNLVDRTLGY